MEQVITGLAWYVVFLFSTVLHEAAHALAAMRGGDLTAYHGGQVTLDPMPHIRREPMGMVLVPVFFFMTSGWLFGWASTPYDPLWAARHPRRSAWMALAGPAANLLLVCAAFALIRIGLRTGFFTRPDNFITMDLLVAGAAGGWSMAAAMMVSILFNLNLILLVFNLLPVPPLDGSNALILLLPEHLAGRYQELTRQRVFSLLGIVVAWLVFQPVFGAVWPFAIRLIYPI